MNDRRINNEIECERREKLKGLPLERSDFGRSWKKYAQYLETRLKKAEQLIHPKDEPYCFDKKKWEITQNDETLIIIQKKEVS